MANNTNAEILNDPKDVPAFKGNFLEVKVFKVFLARFNVKNVENFVKITKIMKVLDTVEVEVEHPKVENFV